jgi:hypothetical protein
LRALESGTRGFVPTDAPAGFFRDALAALDLGDRDRPARDTVRAVSHMRIERA